MTTTTRQIDNYTLVITQLDDGITLSVDHHGETYDTTINGDREYLFGLLKNTPINVKFENSNLLLVGIGDKIMTTTTRQIDNYTLVITQLDDGITLSVDHYGETYDTTINGDREYLFGLLKNIPINVKFENSNLLLVGIGIMFTLKSQDPPTAIDSRGTKIWRRNGLFHRDGDKPAIVDPDGNVIYYQHGDIHRDGDKPAVIGEKGSVQYCKNGKIHREGDEPAVVDVSGRKIYYKDGKIHRDGDQPAIIENDGKVRYYKHGEIHRDGDKPAIIDTDGSVRYYKHGVIHRDGDKPAIIDTDGSVRYYQHGVIHRDGDKPAAIDADGSVHYYKNGKVHRDGDLPAIIAHGRVKYYKNGKLHRDGNQPAAIYPNGDKEYFKNGVEYQPTAIYPNGDKEPYKNVVNNQQRTQDEIIKQYSSYRKAINKLKELLIDYPQFHSKSYFQSVYDILQLPFRECDDYIKDLNIQNMTLNMPEAGILFEMVNVVKVLALVINIGKTTGKLYTRYGILTAQLAEVSFNNKDLRLLPRLLRFVENDHSPILEIEITDNERVSLVNQVYGECFNYK